MTAPLTQYINAMFKLGPSGFIMPEQPDASNYGTLLEVIAQAAFNAQTIADDNLDEIFPDIIGAYLSDWERVLDLPPCGLTDLPAQQRSEIVLAWLNMGPNTTADFLVELAATIGYTITITYDGTIAASERNFHFEVNAASETAIYFRAEDSAAGERLVSYGNNALECVINYFKPAHTLATFIYT